MTISFWRKEAETVGGVMYLPRDEKASELCKLLGKTHIRGERLMDQVWEFCDGVGVRINFYEPIVSQKLESETQDS
jgi:hypothetical protein